MQEKDEGGERGELTRTHRSSQYKDERQESMKTNDKTNNETHKQENNKVRIYRENSESDQVEREEEHERRASSMRISSGRRDDNRER